MPKHSSAAMIAERLNRYIRRVQFGVILGLSLPWYVCVMIILTLHAKYFEDYFHWLIPLISSGGLLLVLVMYWRKESRHITRLKVIGELEDRMISLGEMRESDRGLFEGFIDQYEKRNIPSESQDKRSSNLISLMSKRCEKILSSRVSLKPELPRDTLLIYVVISLLCIPMIFQSTKRSWTTSLPLLTTLRSAINPTVDELHNREEVDHRPLEQNLSQESKKASQKREQLEMKVVSESKPRAGHQDPNEHQNLAKNSETSTPNKSDGELDRREQVKREDVGQERLIKRLAARRGRLTSSSSSSSNNEQPRSRVVAIEDASSVQRDRELVRSQRSDQKTSVDHLNRLSIRFGLKREISVNQLPPTLRRLKGSYEQRRSERESRNNESE